MKKALILFLCCMILFAGCSVRPEPERISDAEFTEQAAEPELVGAYEVVRVVDGDTIIVSIDGTDTRIRLIGIDTPESVHPDESKNTEVGEIAAAYTKELLTDQNVYLEYDIDHEDDYNRTLAYVYLDDQETMVNRLLLEAGQASVMTIQPNSKYAEEFYELQKEAQEAKIGIWNEQ